MRLVGMHELAERGRESDWLILESVVLSDQVPAAELAELLARHPRFHDWLKARAVERQERPS
jgi:hypothetical protein